MRRGQVAEGLCILKARRGIKYDILSRASETWCGRNVTTEHRFSNVNEAIHALIEHPHTRMCPRCITVVVQHFIMLGAARNQPEEEREQP